jgi:SnoaL-like protein
VTGSLSPNQRKAHMDRIYHDWDKALSENDAEALLKLYAKDAVIESPLIPHLLGKADGVCRGQDEMRPFFEAVATRKPSLRQYYRTGYVSDGNGKMMFEYPRAAPRGEQMDFVEVMELNDDGLIQYHKVYWGWRGFAVLAKNEYQRKAA